MRQRLKRWAMFGLMAGIGMSSASIVLSDRGRVSNMEHRVAVLEQRVLTQQLILAQHSQPAVPPVAAAASDGSDQFIEVSGWFIDQPVAGPRGHFTVRPQIRNRTGRDIQMIEAFVLFRTRTGDVICAMDLTRNQTIPAGASVMEPQAHRVGWERLKKLNLSRLRADDIVADLQVTKVVFSDL